MEHKLIHPQELRKRMKKKNKKTWTILDEILKSTIN